MRIETAECVSDEDLRKELVRAILDQSDAVCGNCGNDPRKVDFATVCSEWFMDICWHQEDGGTAIVSCPACWKS